MLLPGRKRWCHDIISSFTATQPSDQKELVFLTSSAMASQGPVNPSHATFDLFVQAQTCKDVKHHFTQLCRQLEIDPEDFGSFYAKLKERLNYWKAKALWTKLDKRASHEDYQQGKVCTKNKVQTIKGHLLSFSKVKRFWCKKLRLWFYYLHDRDSSLIAATLKELNHVS